MRRFFISALSLVFSAVGVSSAIAQQITVGSSQSVVQVSHPAKEIVLISDTKNEKELKKQFRAPYVPLAVVKTPVKAKKFIYHSPRRRFSSPPKYVPHTAPKYIPRTAPKYIAPSPHPIVNNIQLNSASGSPQQIAASIVPSGQLGCFDLVINRESSWNLHAENPSGAYGLPQALPGSKMASAGPDWQNNAFTQLKWALSYMDSRYGSPCGAWSHEVSNGWY